MAVRHCDNDTGRLSYAHEDFRKILMTQYAPCKNEIFILFTTWKTFTTSSVRHYYYEQNLLTTSAMSRYGHRESCQRIIHNHYFTKYYRELIMKLIGYFTSTGLKINYTKQMLEYLH